MKEMKAPERKAQKMTHDGAVTENLATGEVERISDATGAAFSIIPQDNATGNFVKVEQRVPVRISIKPSEHIKQLRAGMNVECTIHY